MRIVKNKAVLSAERGERGNDMKKYIVVGNHKGGYVYPHNIIKGVFSHKSMAENYARIGFPSGPDDRILTFGQIMKEPINVLNLSKRVHDEVVRNYKSVGQLKAADLENARLSNCAKNEIEEVFRKFRLSNRESR